MQLTISNPATTGAPPALNFTLNMNGGNNSAYVLGTAFPTVINATSGDNTINLGGSPPVITIDNQGPVPAKGTALASVFPSPTTLSVDLSGTLTSPQSGTQSLQIPADETLNDFSQPITIDGHSGTSDSDLGTTLTVNDGTDKSGRYALLTATSIAGLSEQNTITFSNIGAMNINLGSGASQFEVQNTPSGPGPVTINTGTGSASVLVDASSATPLVVDGSHGTGNSITFDATSYAQPIQDAMLQDGANSYAGYAELTGFGPVDTVDFTGFQEANLNLGSNINRMTIDESVANLSVNTDQRVITSAGNQIGGNDSNNPGDNTITIKQIGTSSVPDQINGGIGQNKVNVILLANPCNSSKSAIDPSLASLEQLSFSRVGSMTVDDSNNSSPVQWTVSNGKLLVGPNGGVPLLPVGGASSVQITGSKTGTDTLSVQSLSGATDATVSGNNVKLVSGASVLQPGTSNAYNNFSQLDQIMNFSGLTGTPTSYTQTLGSTGFTVTSTNGTGTLVPQPGIISAVAGSSTKTQFTLKAADGGVFALYGVTLSAGGGGTTQVTFTGTTADGTPLPSSTLTVSGSAGFENFPFSPPLTSLTKVTWTPGAALTTNLVVKELYPNVASTTIPSSYDVPATSPTIGGPRGYGDLQHERWDHQRSVHAGL